MLSPAERKRNNFARSLLPGYGAEHTKYEQLYQLYSKSGYTKELCESYVDLFINDTKKPAAEDIVTVAELYDGIHDLKTAKFYLDMLEDRKLSGIEKYNYCIESLKVKSKLGQWRDAVDFRTENINFLQNFSQKRNPQEQADMFIALSLTDCASKHYPEAFKLLRFGYKPHGRNDETLLEIFITGVYIFAKSGDTAGVEEAVANSHACLKLFKEFKFSWIKDYYEKRIAEAAEGIL